MRSPKQIENQIRVIVVAALAKEFRKSQIIKRIIAIAKKNDHIATGALIKPSATASITPSSDDRWLIKRDAVQVKVMKGKSLPSGVLVRLKIEFGIEPQYFWLSERSPDKRWWPNGTAIENWIKLKARRGKRFYIKQRGGEKVMDPGNPSDVSRVAYVISRHLAANGIKKTGLTEPFYGDYGVYSTMRRAKSRYQARIYELYASIMVQEQEQIFTNIA